MLKEFDIKVDMLRRRFHKIGSAVVAFSGGVDSSVLLAIARAELGDRVTAATAVSPGLPESDRRLVEIFCSERKIPHRFVESGEFGDPDFLSNTDDRCYHCKLHLYETLIRLADELGYEFVVEGTNASDLAGHRPGFRASKENGRVATPLVDCGFAKEDVRALARRLGLPMADKPAAACLSSRIPTGERLSPEMLRRVDLAEDILREIGVRQVRVRHHGDVARVEVWPSDMILCMERRDEIHLKLRDLGWRFVALDMSGYRAGGGRE